MPKSDVAVTIPAPNFETFEVTIVGTSPIIFNQFPEKAKKMMLAKQMKEVQKGREAKDPEADYQNSMYRLSDGRVGFPALAIKQAVVGAARTVQGVTMALLRGAIFIIPEDLETGLISVTYEEKDLHRRDDVVRVGMGVADIRVRAEITHWSMTFKIKIDGDVLTIPQTVNLLNKAGFACGLGEWRPEKNGDKGTFEVRG
jgi:hypothetical protein